MSKHMRPRGAGLLLLAGLLGSVAAGYDYVTPATGIDHTGGVILVLVSCKLLLLAALVARAPTCARAGARAARFRRPWCRWPGFCRLS